MPIHPMAMPATATDPRAARPRAPQDTGNLRGTEQKTGKDTRGGQAESIDFTDIHSGLAIKGTLLEPTVTPLTGDMIAAAAPMLPTHPAPETASRLLEEGAHVVAQSPLDSANIETASLPLARGDAGKPELAVQPQQITSQNADADAAPAVVATGAMLPAPRPEAAMPDAMMSDALPVPRADVAVVSPMAQSYAASDVPDVPDKAAPVPTIPAAVTPAAGQGVAPVDLPKAEAVAAAETTARRAEAALDRRAPVAPSSPPPGTETVQAAPPTAMPVAVPQGPPQPAVADPRAPRGEVSITAAERALVEGEAIGISAGPAERMASVASIHAPPPDRGQAAAVMAQVAPTLRKGADGTTEIRLDPPELGRVRLTLRTDDSGLVAIIQAERPETVELMRRNADMLMRDLMAGGQTKVDLSFGSLGPDTGRGDGKEDAPEIAIGPARLATATRADLATQLRLSRAAGGLDIRV